MQRIYRFNHAHLVVLAPVHVGPASNARTVEHIGGLHLRSKNGRTGQSPTNQGHAPSEERAQAVRLYLMDHQHPTHPFDLRYDSCAVFQATGCILELRSLLLEKIAEQAANPARLTEDQEHLRQIVRNLYQYSACDSYALVVLRIQLARSSTVGPLHSSHAREPGPLTGSASLAIFRFPKNTVFKNVRWTVRCCRYVEQSVASRFAVEMHTRSFLTLSILVRTSRRV
eukprot:355515-Chlamydomonas_euryale.AAC.8